jgi:DNA invertase Pin-like site-specific DNA recombinase
MAIFAYTYSDPLLDEPVDDDIWGVEIDQVYADLGQREQLQILMATVQGQTPDYLLLRKLDELGDSLAEIGDRLQSLETLGIKIITTEQDYPGATEADAGQFSQLFSQISQRQISRQLQRGHAKNRRKCLPPPGRTPYGYKRGQDRYLLNRSTAPVVKDFCEYFLLYGSLRGAVRHLEQRFGKKIAVSTGRKWLTNPVYRGHLHYKDGVTIPNTHVPILGESEAAQIDRLIRRNQKVAPRSASAPRSLAGLVQCGQCQSKLTVCRVTRRGKQKEYLYLRPLDCPEESRCKAIAYDEVFQLTVEAICREFPKIVQNIQAPPLEQIQSQLHSQIQTKQALLDQLPSLMDQGVFDAQTAELRRYHLHGEIAQLQNRQNQLPPANLAAIAKTITLEQFWFDLSEAEKRFYLREFLDQIQIQRQESGKWEIQLKFIF